MVNDSAAVDSLIPALAAGGASSVKTFGKFDRGVYAYLADKASTYRLPIAHDPGPPLFHEIPLDVAVAYGVGSIEHGKAHWPAVLVDSLAFEHDSLMAAHAPKMAMMMFMSRVFESGERPGCCGEPARRSRPHRVTHAPREVRCGRPARSVDRCRFRNGPAIRSSFNEAEGLAAVSDRAGLERPAIPDDQEQTADPRTPSRRWPGTGNGHHGEPPDEAAPGVRNHEGCVSRVLPGLQATDPTPAVVQ